MQKNKGSRLLLTLAATGVFALGLTTQANADSVFAAPQFGFEVQQQQSFWRELLERILAALRRNPPQPSNPPSDGGRNVPELSLEVGGAAVVLLVGGLLVLTSRRKRHKDATPS